MVYHQSTRAAALLSCFPALAYGTPPPHFQSPRDAALLKAVAERTANHKTAHLARPRRSALDAPLPAVSPQVDEPMFGLQLSMHPTILHRSILAGSSVIKSPRPMRADPAIQFSP